MIVNSETFTPDNTILGYAFTEPYTNDQEPTDQTETTGETSSTHMDPILDYAYKNDISYNDTSAIYNLEPKTYTYISDPDAGTQIGYIAEDTINIHPNFTTYNGYTDPLTPVAINYEVITVFLVEEMKKLKQQITDLTTQNQALSTRITALENP
jgi:hypothetical protein